MATLPIYVDIDGTLTREPEKQWGPVIEARVNQIKKLIASGKTVVIWSGGGSEYAMEFARRNGILGAICLGKPCFCVDDNPDIRPRSRMRIIPPGEFFDGAR